MSKQKPVTKKSVGLIDIYPSLGKDTVNGKRITSGSLFMGINAGSGSTEHKGKKVEFTVMTGMDGSTILLGNARYAKINLVRMVEAAIKAGWLEEILDFKEATA